jgi:hypothetical protein
VAIEAVRWITVRVRRRPLRSIGCVVGRLCDHCRRPRRFSWRKWVRIRHTDFFSFCTDVVFVERRTNFMFVFDPNTAVRIKKSHKQSRVKKSMCSRTRTVDGLVTRLCFKMKSITMVLHRSSTAPSATWSSLAVETRRPVCTDASPLSRESRFVANNQTTNNNSP